MWGREEFVLADARLWSVNLVRWSTASPGRPVDESTVEPETLASYAWGREVSGAEFVDALDVRNRIARSAGACFTARDVLLTPTLPGVPVPLGPLRPGRAGRRRAGPGRLEHLFHRSPFTAAFNVAGPPAMSVPPACGLATGLPVGVRFAAGHGGADVLFRLTAPLERPRRGRGAGLRWGRARSGAREVPAGRGAGGGRAPWRAPRRIGPGRADRHLRFRLAAGPRLVAGVAAAEGPGRPVEENGPCQGFSVRSGPDGDRLTLIMKLPGNRVPSACVSVV
ncbi:amidase family protein [Streptomyces virginiae]|uniref:amidase family protein n=1 Tax=Streptomyces virginiae TaxID=1961 RepID=UPI00339E52A1